MPRTKKFNIVCKNCEKEFLSCKTDALFCSRTCSAKYNNKHGLIGRKKKPIDGKIRTQCVSMYRNGKSYRYIAKRLNISYVSIRLCLSSEGIDPKTPWKSWDSLSHKNGRKRHLIKERGNCCEKCKLKEWNGVPIPLEMHHINGNKNDNEKPNLLLLCPNCHTLTENYCGKNISKVR